MARRPGRSAPKGVRLPYVPGAPVPGRARRRPQSGGRPAGRWLRTAYAGAAGSRSYDVYLPQGHRRTTPVPLLMLLHGCNQSPEDFVASTRFTTLADRHGFVIAAPRQTRAHHAGGCWHWYEPAHQVGGAGEPAILAGIAGMVVAEPVRWRIDPSRVYAAGISAGGAMALILAATHPDLFAAIGVHSAPAYRSASSASNALGAMRGRGAVVAPAPGDRMAPLVVVQGTADAVVNGRNGDQVAQQWLTYDELRSQGSQDPQRIVRSRSQVLRWTDGRRYTVRRWYSARGRKRLEYWQVEGLGHAWSGGLSGRPYSDPRGPRASTAMWRFFALHTL